MIRRVRIQGLEASGSLLSFLRKNMRKTGQSTIEYILLVTAVIGVIIALTATSGSPFRTKLNSTITTTMGGMETEAAKLTSAINQ